MKVTMRSHYPSTPRLTSTHDLGLDLHHCPGGTKAQYDAVLKAVHVTKDKLPEGQLFHAAGQSAGGWTVIAVHDSKESWERFRDTILMPTLKRGKSTT